MTLEQNARAAKQAAIWAAIRQHYSRDKWFTVNGLICAIARDGTRVNDDTVKSYVLRLFRAGYLERKAHGEKAGARQEYLYHLVRDTGVETPRVRKDGAAIDQGRSYKHLWKGMQILREFTPRELAISASTNDCQISTPISQTYCFALAQAGYLVVIESARTGSSTRYRFVASRNSGPQPPQLQYIKQVFDQNLQKVVWVQDGGAE